MDKALGGQNMVSTFYLTLFWSPSPLSPADSSAKPVWFLLLILVHVRMIFSPQYIACIPCKKAFHFDEGANLGVEILTEYSIFN